MKKRRDLTFLNYQKTSVSNALGTLLGRDRLIFHTDLKLNSYKIMTAQKFDLQDFTKRREACNVLLTGISPDDIMWTSYKAHFHLCGIINHKLHQRPLHGRNVRLQFAMLFIGIIGIYFFEEGGSINTVTSANYFEIDEATHHTARLIYCLSYMASISTDLTHCDFFYGVTSTKTFINFDFEPWKSLGR